jgi:hypothetical protein
MKSTTRILALLACLALAACDGTAVVTLTATPATTLAATPGTVSGFLTYRITLVSVALQQSSGSGSENVLASPVSIDLAQSTNFSEILGSSSIRKGTYTSVAVTLDYSNATIVADNGTLGGLPLTPQNVNGQGVSQVLLTLEFDPASPLVITKGNTSQLSLDFLLTASNNVNPTAGIVIVNPVLAASSLPIDTKLGRLRGLLSGAMAATTTSTASSTDNITGTSVSSTTVGTYSTGIKPFDGLVSGGGSMSVSPTPTTVFEVNGTPSIGTAGFGALAALSPGSWIVAYGTLASTTSTTDIPLSTTTPDTTGTSDVSTGLFGTSTDTTPTDTTTTTPLTTAFTTSTNVSFTPTQIWAGSSVQGGGLDRISGVVTARNGSTLIVPSATWTTSAGVTSFVSGAATITGGPGTAIILPAQAGAQANSVEQVSVGSVIDAFGTATEGSGGNVSLDVTAGRVRLENTVASGLVTVQGTTSLTVGLSTLGGRSVAPFVFTGTGSTAAQYEATTSGLDLSNSTPGAPVELTGLTALYGAAPPDFIATLLLDYTTINAELVLDWGSGGTEMPFAAMATGGLELLNTGIVPGLRHQIAVGAYAVDLTTLGSDVTIEPSTSTTLVYSIVHASTATVENFNTFAAFATQLQSELNGTTVVTLITADGIYTPAGAILTATSVTVDLNV